MSVMEEQVKQIMIDMDAQRAEFEEKIQETVFRMNAMELDLRAILGRVKTLEQQVAGAVIINEEVIGQAIGLELVKQLRHGTARVIPRKTTILEKEDF